MTTDQPQRLLDLLPPEIAQQIRRQFQLAAQKAASFYQDYSEDEDAVTGALGGAMNLIVEGIYSAEGHDYSWKTRTKKFRGRGPDALEKKLGADGIIEFEIQDLAGKTIKRKSLLFQSKKQSSSSNLLKQAHDMSSLPGESCVINYDSSTYEAVQTSNIIRARGKWDNVKSKHRRTLGEMLADEFLSCNIGTYDIHFDSSQRVLLVERNGQQEVFPFKLSHLITTTIKSV